MSLVRSITWQQTTLPDGTVFSAGTIIADCYLQERHDDDSVITENPVENGSVTNDHKYDLPQTLELTYIWSPASIFNANQSTSYLNQMYQKCLDLKSAAIFLAITTGKRQYKNMLVKSISETTDENTENILMLHVVCKQMILAITQTVTLSNSAVQSMPKRTSGVVNQGSTNLQPAPNYNSGNP